MLAFDKDIFPTGARKGNCTWQHPTLSEPLQDFTQWWNMEISMSQPFCSVAEFYKEYVSIASLIQQLIIVVKWLCSDEMNVTSHKEKRKKKVSGKVKTLEVQICKRCKWKLLKKLPVTEMHCGCLVSPAWGEKRKKKGRARKVTHFYPVLEGPGCHCLCH